jgi:hypothetical protein
MTEDSEPVVTVHRLPSGEPFAVVINATAIARTSVSADGGAVTISLRLPGRMPCAVIFPEEVAAHAFGRDFATWLASDSGAQDGDG